MKLKIFLLSVLFPVFVFSQNEFDSIVSNNITLNTFKQIFQTKNEIITDSCCYYFNKSDQIVELPGIGLFCGLLENTNSFNVEYYQVGSDSTLLLVKFHKFNSETITLLFLKRTLLKTVYGTTEGCWFNHFMKMEFDKNGFLLNMTFYNEDEIKLQKIIFR